MPNFIVQSKKLEVGQVNLLPLGWTCIGNLVLDDSPVLRTNFAYTYFLRDQSVIGQANIGLNRCREIEDTGISPLQEISVEQNDEQIARKNVQHSIPCESVSSQHTMETKFVCLIKV